MNDLAAVEQRGVVSYSVNEVRAQVQQVQLLMKEVMKEGTHFGNSFPGDTKKNLLKPGADKLMFIFRLRPDFKQEIKDLPNGHREIITRCEVFHIESGNKIAEGVGSASTMESKYRWRSVGRVCPHCGKDTIKKSKYGSGGYYCYEKIGGCGAKFKDDDPAITNQQTGKIENPDIADCYNTVLKISKKRAYVDATITATAASDIFTQDLEDLSGDDKPDDQKGAEGLAGEALDGETPPPSAPAKPQNPAPQNSAKPPQNPPQNGQNPTESERKEKAKKLIGEILTTNNPDSLPYFNQKELELEGKIFDTSGIADIEKQYFRLKSELEKRIKNYQPIPFGDDGFQDDIPV